jgi:hypothetical protein
MDQDHKGSPYAWLAGKEMGGPWSAEEAQNKVACHPRQEGPTYSDYRKVYLTD